jgi:cytidine deaminase
LTDKEMVDAAREARLNAYSPYSGFRVGACLKAASGKIYLGCNVESVSFTPTCCAERTALFSAVAAGEREFTAIAVACDGKKPAWPCGVCRQSLMEFSPDMMVIVAAETGGWEKVKLSELLPHSFSDFTGDVQEKE